MAPDEKARLQAEWAKMQGLGSALARRRMIATGAGVAVAAPFCATGIFVMLFISLFVGVGLFVVGLPLGWMVRNWLYPKGQFG